MPKNSASSHSITVAAEQQATAYTIFELHMPVATLQPADSSKTTPVRDVIDQLKQFRRGHHLDGLSIRDMIEEGGADAHTVCCRSIVMPGCFDQM